jgi:hypothetical protein
MGTFEKASFRVLGRPFLSQGCHDNELDGSHENDASRYHDDQGRPPAQDGLQRGEEDNGQDDQWHGTEGIVCPFQPTPW